jgi:hypothetical protein
MGEKEAVSPSVGETVLGSGDVGGGECEDGGFGEVVMRRYRTGEALMADFAADSELKRARKALATGSRG